jgi:hypothetical protein
MSKIIRTLAFILVLAGLLTWGVSTLAQAPTRSVTTSGVQIVTGGEELQTAEHGSTSGVHYVGR